MPFRAGTETDAMTVSPARTVASSRWPRPGSSKTGSKSRRPWSRSETMRQDSRPIGSTGSSQTVCQMPVTRV